MVASVPEFTRRDGVEVAAQDVEAVLVALDTRSSARNSNTRRCSVHAAWTALRCTPKMRTRSPAGTISMNACRETRGRVHFE
jgi:hypothetical protein